MEGTAAPITPINPKVFISYSWESQSHKDWVRYLAEQLVVNGVDVLLDQWHVSGGESFTTFMENSVATADYVILVCTPTYAQKSNARKGGVGYEQQIVSGQLISGTARSKFIPIVRLGDYDIGPNCSIPTHFSGIATIDFRHPSEFHDKLEDLLRILHRKPKYGPPPVGSVPQLETQRYTTLDAFEKSPHYTGESEEKVARKAGSAINRRDFIRHLTKFGCELSREGAKNSIFINRSTRSISAVPRSSKILRVTANRICLDLRIPKP